MHRIPVFFVIASSGCTIFVDGERDDTATVNVAPPEGITELLLQVEAGEVDVVPGDRLRIEATFEWWARTDASPELIRDEADGYGGYEFLCPQGSRECEIEVKVTLPEEIAALSVEGTAVDVETFGLAADLTVRAEVGPVSISGHDGDVDVVVETGSVEAMDVCAEEIRVAARIAEVEIDVCDRPALIDVALHTGEAEISVPAGAYAVDADPGAFGELTLTRIDVDPEADSALVVQIEEVGDITIEGR